MNAVKNMYLSCFLAKGTRLEALFRFSVMWHLTREIQGSRVTSHNRSFDRYFPFPLAWTYIYMFNYIMLYYILFSEVGKSSLQRPKKKEEQKEDFITFTKHGAPCMHDALSCMKKVSIERASYMKSSLQTSFCITGIFYFQRKQNQLFMGKRKKSYNFTSYLQDLV